MRQSIKMRRGWDLNPRSPRRHSVWAVLAPRVANEKDRTAGLNRNSTFRNTAQNRALPTAGYTMDHEPFIRPPGKVVSNYQHRLVHRMLRHPQHLQHMIFPQQILRERLDIFRSLDLDPGRLRWIFALLTSPQPSPEDSGRYLVAALRLGSERLAGPATSTSNLG